MNTNAHQDIAWNGALITIPSSWEPHVAGRRHIIFEDNFQPLVEIRWENGSKFQNGNFSSVLKKLKKQTSSRIYNKKPQEQWLPFGDLFETICYTTTNGQTIDGGVWFCLKSKTLILFQLFPDSGGESHKIISSLATLCFPNLKRDRQWRMQDFSLVTPASFVLTSYTFAPGFTRLSFSTQDLDVQICRLAPADSRLDVQSIDSILRTLMGTSKVPATITHINNGCEAHRNPTILQQILLRLRREKPFIYAKLWHDTASNRLLGVVLTSRRPIPEDIADTLCQHYEIIQKQKKNTTTDQT